MSLKNKIIFVIITIIIIGLTLDVIVVQVSSRQAKLPREIQPIASVQVQPAKYQDIYESIITYGQVNFIPNKIEQLTMQNEVIIKQVFVVTGQLVTLNDPLFKLESSINFASSLIDAELAVSFAEKQLDRISSLRDQFLATNVEVQTATQNLNKAKIKLLALQKQQQNETEGIIRADFSGTIIVVNIQSGQIVSANTSLLAYSKGNSRQIRLGVESEYLTKLKQNQEVIISSLQNKEIKQTGNISNITGVVNSITGLLDVIVNFDDADSLIPGNMVRGEIIIQAKKPCLTVSHSAVLYQQGNPYLYVIANNTAQQRWVKTSPYDSNTIIIDQGIKVGEPVVITGNYELKNGMDVRVMEQLK